MNLLHAPSANQKVKTANVGRGLHGGQVSLLLPDDFMGDGHGNHDLEAAIIDSIAIVDVFGYASLSDISLLTAIFLLRVS